MKLTIFYDGLCPLCASEMRVLQKLDTQGNLLIEDIHDEKFENRFPHIDPVAADRILHGQFENGSMIYGLDVTYQSWKAVGRKPWLAVLRWPIVRWFADAGYLMFARNRYWISRLVTGRERCEPCANKASSRCDI